MQELAVSIVTPYGEIFSKKVRSVTLPGIEGEFGVLSGHSEILSSLKSGVIEIEMTNHIKDLIAIDWGYAKVNAQQVDILVNGAVFIGGSDESEISEAISNAKSLLEGATSDNLVISNVVSRIEICAKGKI